MGNTDAKAMLGKPLAESLQRAIQSTMNDGFQISTELESWSVGTGPLALDPSVMCLIEMKQDGAHWGAFILAFSRETVMQVLSRYGITDTSDPKVVDDAAAEIANMIYGMVKTSINKLGYRFSMNIPSPIHGSKSVNEQYAATDKMIMPFLADGHQCRIVIACDPVAH